MAFFGSNLLAEDECEYLESEVSIPSTSTPMFTVIEGAKSSPVVDFSQFSIFNSLIRVCPCCSDLLQKILILSFVTERFFYIVYELCRGNISLKNLSSCKKFVRTNRMPFDLQIWLTTWICFVNEDGLIRSKRRLSRSNYYENEVLF